MRTRTTTTDDDSDNNENDDDDPVKRLPFRNSLFAPAMLFLCAISFHLSVLL